MAAKRERKAKVTEDPVQAEGYDKETGSGLLPLVVMNSNPPDCPRVYVGCAGWSIPKEHKTHFPVVGTHLERYAGRLRAVEINTSFYRPHRPETYARWAASVPSDFQFAVKFPRAITHEHRLEHTGSMVNRFLDECTHLGHQLGPLLVQLPPSLAFNNAVVHPFFASLRKQFQGEVVCEPRHRSWFNSEADRLLNEMRVARAAVDPSVVPAAVWPAGYHQLVYFRLHGSPEMYYSAYSGNYLKSLQRKLEQFVASATVWCIFDNTALGAATVNALALTGAMANTSIREARPVNPVE